MNSLRRSVGLFGVAILLVCLLALPSATPHETNTKELRLGDTGYNHDGLHDVYGRYFKGQCPCSIGECRPTEVRANEKVPDTGMEVLVDRAWYPVPKDAVKFRTGIPVELLEYPAHVCARKAPTSGGEDRMIIECLIYNGAI